MQIDNASAQNTESLPQLQKVGKLSALVHPDDFRLYIEYRCRRNICTGYVTLPKIFLINVDLRSLNIILRHKMLQSQYKRKNFSSFYIIIKQKKLRNIFK